jgi:hypothetical protein
MEEDGYVWQWFNNDAQQFVDYSIEHAKKIEDAYNAKQLDAHIDIGFGIRSTDSLAMRSNLIGKYTICLDTFAQYNDSSGYKRIIQRVPSVPPLPSDGSKPPDFGSFVCLTSVFYLLLADN